MARLGIISIYDSEGKIYPYIEYYLSEIKKVVQSMVIVFNGTMKTEEKEKLKKFTTRIYERQNIGYDAGAYRYVFRQSISDEEWNLYDEIILSNDTVFGPFQPFEDIFKEMDQRGDCDFWGINGVEDGPYRYLQSNFLVLKKQTFSSLRKYFEEKIDEYADTVHKVCIQFERGLYVSLMREGFQAGSYLEYNDLDAYNSSFYLIRDHHDPTMKKAADLTGYQENVLCAIDYLRKKKTYPVVLITNYFFEKYGLWNEKERKRNLTLTDAHPLKIHFSRYGANRNEILEFINAHLELYIYGTGNEADYLWIHFEDKMRNLKGFLVSDNKERKDCCHQYSVYEISQMENKDIGIIVALNPKDTMEVKEHLRDFPNVLYLYR